MLSINGEKKKVAGIIVECNPFHKGHIRLIKECRKHADIIVAVMSGNFVQRGEPAVYDKEKRTRDLISHGVDLVIELPLYASLSSARYFADSAVRILDELKFIDYLVFGSKIADIDRLSELAVLADGTLSLRSGAHPTSDCACFATTSDFNRIVKRSLREGKSYAKAMGLAYGTDLSPNDILAVEYLKSLNELKSKIRPIAIERKNDLPTASELRSKMKKKITCDDFSSILNYKLLYAKATACDKKENILDDIYLMTTDMRNAILKTSDIDMSFEERARSLNTKNRTLANIKRLFFNVIFDIKKEDMKNSGLAVENSPLDCFPPTKTKENSRVKNISYIHILGVNENGKSLLKYIKIPFLMSFAPASYRTFIEKYKNNPAVKKNKSGGFTLAPIINKTIFADKLLRQI